MKTVNSLVGLVLLIVSVSATATETEHGSSRDVATGPAEKQVLDVERYAPTQVFCMVRKRTGSRVSRNVCQTLAEWKHEANQSAMRSTSLIRPSGRRPGWE